MTRLDVVSVAHRAENWQLMHEMFQRILEHHPHEVNLISIDNRPPNNRGFGAGCNLGSKEGTAPIIGFLNPDVKVQGPFVEEVEKVLLPPTETVITGERFDKPDHELRSWGCRDWVVGACMFVRRDWWELYGGFDERFFLYFEETDLVRRAETGGYKVQSIKLPLHHASPLVDHPEDVTTKRYWFAESGRLYHQKWKFR